MTSTEQAFRQVTRTIAELSKASVTRTTTAAREHTNAMEGGTGDD